MSYDLIDTPATWLLAPDDVAERVHRDSALRGVNYAIGEREAGKLTSALFVTWLPQQDTYELANLPEFPREMPDEASEDAGNTERDFTALMRGQAAYQVRLECADRRELYRKWIPRMFAALWHQLGPACRVTTGRYEEPTAEGENVHRYVLDLTLTIQPGESSPTARAEAITQATTSTPVIGT